MRDPRSIWAVTKGGDLVEFRWALVRTPEEAERIRPALPGAPAQLAALAPDEDPAAGWDATPTAWRRVPRLLRAPKALQESGRIAGGKLHAHGCAWSLGDRGRDRGPDQEPDEPGVEVLDPAALAPGP